MFSGLRSNNVFYILEKGEKPCLKVGQVMSVSNPMPRLGAVPYTNDTYVDVSVKVGDEQMEFKQLPSALSIANSGSVVVSDNRESMLNEVDGMRRISEDVLNSMDYHRSVVDACDGILVTLNPTIAKEKATEERMGAMEERMGGIEGTLTSIQEMLSNALGKSSKTK